jgi:hypothetical protein
MLVGARFSKPVQTGPEANPASYTTGTGYFPGVKRLGRGVYHPLHLSPRLKKEYSYTSTPPLGLRGLFWGELYFYFTLILHFKLTVASRNAVRLRSFIIIIIGSTALGGP